MIGRIMALYVFRMVSLCWPHDVPVRALRMFRRRLALFWMLATWSLKV